tara:strand:+ start:170 stop:955 length:786 start_codon:yes stop_codon:yes gene_type:complete
VTNLQKRISSGLVLLILLAFIISSVSLIPDVAIYVLVLLTLFLSYEYSRFFKEKSLSILFLSVILLSVILPSKIYLWLVILGCLIWLSLFIRILLYDNPSMTNAEIFIAGYLMIVPSLISGIIIFDVYAKLLILILIAVSFADSSAYFFGKKFGNKILLKNTSPGKTLEGLIGASISTPIFLGLISGLVDIKLSGAILFGLIITPVSFIGDVSFSFIKRSANIKDSSNLIPGHGGFIDLLDGSVASLPFFALLLMNLSENF